MCLSLNIALLHKRCSLLSYVRVPHNNWYVAEPFNRRVLSRHFVRTWEFATVIAEFVCRSDHPLVIVGFTIQHSSMRRQGKKLSCMCCHLFAHAERDYAWTATHQLITYTQAALLIKVQGHC